MTSIGLGYYIIFHFRPLVIAKICNPKTKTF